MCISSSSLSPFPPLLAIDPLPSAIPRFSDAANSLHFQPSLPQPISQQWKEGRGDLYRKSTLCAFPPLLFPFPLPPANRPPPQASGKTLIVFGMRQGSCRDREEIEIWQTKTKQFHWHFKNITRRNGSEDSHGRGLMYVPTIHALPVLNELNCCIENMHENTNHHI